MTAASPNGRVSLGSVAMFEWFFGWWIADRSVLIFWSRYRRAVLVRPGPHGGFERERR